MNERSDFPPSPPTSRVTWIIFGVVAAAMVAIVIYPGLTRDRDTISPIVLVTSTLLSALKQYKEEMGEYPTGDSRAVSKALQGANPKQIQFIDLHQRDISPDGDLLDPWGTPYEFYFGERPLIRSAGKNKQFDDSSSKHCDDYYRD